MTDDTDTQTAAPEPDPTTSAEDLPAESAAASTRPARWRRWLAWTLLVLGTVVLLVTSANLWFERQLLQTDSWVEASGKLLADDEIRGALSVYLVDELYANVDVSASVTDAVSNNVPEGSAQADLLVPLATAIGPLVETALKEVSVTVTDNVLASSQVQQLWKDANRVVHSALVAVITEDPKLEIFDVDGGVVALDLKPIVAELGSQFGFDVNVDELPPEAAEIVILESGELEAVQDAVRVIQKMSVLLILIVLGLFGLAIYLPKGQRRRMVMACASSLLLIGILLLVAKTIAGEALVNAIAEDSTDRGPMNAAWAIATELLRDIALTLISYGIVLLVGAWLAGPARWAVAVRRWLAPSFRGHPAVVFAAVALVILVALLWSPTDSSRELIGTLVLIVAVFLGVEALRRKTLREFPETPENEDALSEASQTV